VRSLSFLIPGDLQTRTGGYGYDRRIAAGLSDLGWTVDIVSLDGSFPQPTSEALRAARLAFAAIPNGSVVLIDGLAFGAMPEESSQERQRLRLAGLVHHPLAQETGIDPSLAAALEDSERRALASARRVVVTSRATARGLARYDVPADRIVVVEPGTDPRAVASGSNSRTIRLLAVAALVPRKGQDVLIEALAQLMNRQWTLTLVGGADRDPAFASRLRTLVEQRGLTERVEFAGEMDGEALERFYVGADVFVLPTHHEGYGMAVAEAIAHALPVVSTVTGGIPEIVGKGGILLPAPDRDVLLRVLAHVLDDDALRARLREAARAAREHLPTWEDAARRMADALDAI
jgi:glycosyltransferase involved in cell wall biosynthesis